MNSGSVSLTNNAGCIVIELAQLYFASNLLFNMSQRQWPPPKEMSKDFPRQKEGSMTGVRFCAQT
jgi:hypothetical protein